MKWLVYIFNINSQKMEVHDIFDHYKFNDDVNKALTVCKTKEEFAAELMSNLRYYYWCKAEWEIVIKPWVGGRDCIENKIDVFSQVVNNWEVFLDYCWSFREELLKS